MTCVIILRKFALSIKISIIVLIIMIKINVAKCNLCKVKIQPMLVAGCVLWAQRVTNPTVHVT